MPDPHVAAQAQHVLGSKNLTHEAVILSLMQARSLASSNTRRILAAML
jgi:AraC-like DNA-binding protein